MGKREDRREEFGGERSASGEEGRVGRSGEEGGDEWCAVRRATCDGESRSGVLLNFHDMLRHKPCRPPPKDHHDL